MKKTTEENGINIPIKPETVVVLTAIAAILVVACMVFAIELFALSKGIDGTVLQMTMLTLGGMVGAVATLFTCYVKFIKNKGK